MSSLSLSVGRPVLVDLIPGALIRDAAAVLVGAGVTGLAAQVSIHTSLSPVPFTLQTLAVLTVGAAVGTWRGITSMLLYLVVGMAGVPWFANHSHGIGGPSFGYVLGFVAAAGITGFLAKRGADRSILGTVVLMVLGSLAVYAVGTAWLAADLGVGVNTAFDLGTRPFLATDAIKIAVAALAFPAAWRLARSDA
jgi:biotin transport system substrate-specific component